MILIVVLLRNITTTVSLYFFPNLKIPSPDSIRRDLTCSDYLGKYNALKASETNLGDTIRFELRPLSAHVPHSSEIDIRDSDHRYLRRSRAVPQRETEDRLQEKRYHWRGIW